MVWLAVRVGEDGYRSGVLCRRHADAMVVPKGWILDDRREMRPRLFRSPATDDAVAEAITGPAPEPPVTPAVPRRAPRRRPARPRPAVDDTTLAFDLEGESRTVAAVTGGPSVDDPDATVAMPWNPRFDDDDDLDGVLSADSPLLARAFRGTDRPRH